MNSTSARSSDDVPTAAPALETSTAVDNPNAQHDHASGAGDSTPDTLLLSDTLSVMSLITPEMMGDLQTELQWAVERATAKRKLAAFAKGARVLWDADNPVFQWVVTAIYGVLDRFFTQFFESHPELDKNMKDKIMSGYKTSLDTVANAFAQAKDPEAAQKAQKQLVDTFLNIFENNPELRNLQITSLRWDLASRMASADKIYIPKQWENDRKHGEREGWQNAMGMWLIIAETLATGYAMSNWIENEAFRRGYWLLPGASYVPGGLAAFFTAMGGQALAKAILKERKPGKGVWSIMKEKPVLWVWALAVAGWLGLTAYKDYDLSKSGVWVAAATTWEVKSRTTAITAWLGDIVAHNNKAINAGSQSIGSAVSVIKNREADRWGKYLFYSLKSFLLTGSYAGLWVEYDTPSELLDKVKDLDTKKWTTVEQTMKSHETSLASISYVDPALQKILRDPKASYEAKMWAIGSQYMAIFAKSTKAVSALNKRASEPPHLTVETMLMPSHIGEFADGNDAQAALAQLWHTLNALPKELEALRIIEAQLKSIYIRTLNALEENAKKAFAGNATLAINTLPSDLNLGLSIPDTTGLSRLASSPLTQFRGLSTEQAMAKVGEIYGPQIQSEVDKFVLLRAALFISMLGVGQWLLVYLNIRRRSKDADEIETVGAECMKQINVIVDTLYAWTQSSLSKLMNREDGSEIVSRSFCEHIVWSWLIDLDPSLREFAPPTYLGEKAWDKSWKNYFMQLLTCDVRPDTDRRTESLYEIFRDRIRAGSLMNEKDISFILDQFHLGKGDDIARRVQDLWASIATGSAEYDLRSKNDPSDAAYIAQSRDSLSAKKEKEIQAMKDEIMRKHIQSLQNLWNSIVSGEYQDGNKVLDNIQSLSWLYQKEAQDAEDKIKAKYQISSPKKTITKVLTDKPSMWSRMKWWLTQPEHTEENPEKDDNPPKKSTTVESVPLSVGTLSANIAWIESRLAKHASWVELLKSTDWKERFIAEVLWEDISDIEIPESVLESVHSIEKYRSLMSSIDGATDAMKKVRDTMDGETDIPTLEGILVDLATKVNERQSIIENEGTEFSAWVQYISTLLDGFDALQEHTDAFEPKVITVDVELEPIVWSPEAMKEEAIRRVAQAIAWVANQRALTLEDFQVDTPVEMTFIRGGKYSVTRLSGDTFDIQSLDNPSEISMNISLEDLNLMRRA